MFDVRGDEDAAASVIRERLHRVDPNVPILEMRGYTEQVRSNFTEQDFVVRLTSGFGLLALLLAALGLYGVTAYSVTRRTGEIGLRMALGATRVRILLLVVRSTLTQAAAGVGLGLLLALSAGRLLRHSLYQTSAFQPVLLLDDVGLLLTATVAAALLPARRAASVNPTDALRGE